MNDSEVYKEWSLLPEVSGKVLIDKLEDSEEGLTISLRFPSYSTLHGQKVQLLFDSYVAYRNMDESYRARTFDVAGGFKGSLYLVEGSSWLKWLHKESLGIYQDDLINHYSIITEADCIDVLSEYKPAVNWIK